MHLKAHKVMQQGRFFFHYSLATFTLTTNWAKNITSLLLYAYVEIHQVSTGLWHLPKVHSAFDTHTKKATYQCTLLLRNYRNKFACFINMFKKLKFVPLVIVKYKCFSSWCIPTWGLMHKITNLDSIGHRSCKNKETKEHSCCIK